MAASLDQHAAWLARTLGRTDYLPLRPDDAVALADAGVVVDKHRGTHLFREGDEATACFIVKEGEVELYRRTAAGRSIVGRQGQGSVVGDIAMFQDRPYLSSARAIGQVKAIRLERDALIPLLLARPVLAMRWLVNGLVQLEAAQQRLIRLIDRTVIEQVSGVIIDEQDAYGEVAMSQASIAELLGASRQAVNEALRELKAMGAVETAYRRISILDAVVLAGVASR